MYDLDIIYCANMGQKINSLVVNGEGAGDITFQENTKFEPLNVGAIYLRTKASIYIQPQKETILMVFVPDFK